MKKLTLKRSKMRNLVYGIPKKSNDRARFGYKIYDAFEDRGSAIRAGKATRVKYSVRKLKVPEAGGRLKFGVYLKDKRFV